jgi:hypothetical protein
MNVLIRLKKRQILGRTIRENEMSTKGNDDEQSKGICGYDAAGIYFS